MIYGSDTDKHGIQLDVHMEEEFNSSTLLENSDIFDVEAESKDKEGLKSQLPRRMRFYHAKIAADCLGSGNDYRKLKNVVVVMIMPFDRFGYDHMIYTIQNACLEIPELSYDDGAKTLYLYTKGKNGNPSKALRELLEYMNSSCLENVKNEKLEQIHNMVTAVKQNAKVSVSYMKHCERENILKQIGFIEGVIQTCLEMGLSVEDIVEKLISKYGMDEIQAKETVKLYQK